MSERINVDHAFDPEARQAQAEFDAYIDSRPYQDDKGNVHNPENGQFVDFDAYSEANHEDHYDTTLAEGDYSGESLEQLAQRVAAARAEGDRTRAEDAENAFYEKFTVYSEKYGWDKEDDSVYDETRVDKDTPMGRTTVDDRLERYSKIMYGEAKTEDFPAPAEKLTKPTVEAVEDAKETTDGASDTSNGKAETNLDSKEDTETDEAAPEHDLAAIKAKRAQMVKDGLRAGDVGNMSNEQIANYNLVERASEQDSEVSDAEEATVAEKASLPAGHVEYDGKQWEVVAINVDEATGEKSFHLVHTASTGLGKKTHLTVGETDLNLPEDSDEADDSIDTSKFAWAGEAKNTEYQGDASSDSIDLDQFKWANEENEDQPTDEAEDEATTVDTRGRGRRWLNRIKDQYKATVVAGGGNFLAGTFNRLRDYAPERHEGETDEDYERRRQDSKVAMGLGAVAVFGLGAYGMVKGIDMMSGDGNGTLHAAASNGMSAGAELGVEPSTDASRVVPVGAESAADTLSEISDLSKDSLDAGVDISDNSSSSIDSVATEANPESPDYSDAAKNVVRGEGGFQTLKELDIPEQYWEEVWQGAGEVLQQDGLVYVMDDGRFGWNSSMALEDKHLDAIMQAYQDVLAGR